MNRIQKWLPLTTLALILAACGGTTSSSLASSTSTPSSTTSSASSAVTLTSITIAGATSATIDFNTQFNLLTGVTATGNNGVNYTSNITRSSISSAVNVITGALDTTKTGPHIVTYDAIFGGVSAPRIFRTITVAEPARTGMLINADFSQGTAGWDQSEPLPVLYEADGGTIALSIENGELKTEVVSGSNSFTPRFGQMEIPFVEGTIYEVSFDARSSVTKEISLQVGEIVNGAPYFNDFLPAANKFLYKTITAGSTMNRYTYQFKMNTTNVLGGILFGLGTVNGQDVNATLYFDNIEVEAVTVDTFAPFIKGATDVTLSVDQVFNPLTGVTAVDMVEGLISEIDAEIRNSQNEIVSAVDTTAPGVFTITYTASDSANNTSTATRTVNVVGMNFLDENLLTNGSFADAVGDEWESYQTTELDTWAPSPKPIVVKTQDIPNDTYSLDITNGGGEPWAIQLFQQGIELIEGTTYRFSVTASATTARKISFATGYPLPENQFNEYARKNGIDIGTTSSTQEFVFTVTKATADVRIVLELGSQEGFADGTLVLEEVRLQRLDEDPIIANGNFNLSGWRGFGNFWHGTSYSTEIVDGEFSMTVDALVPDPEAGQLSWHLQIVQDAESLEGIPGVSNFLDLEAEKTYTLSFEAYATEAVTITPNIFGQEIFSNHVESPASVLTTQKQVFTKTVSTVGAILNDTEKLAFEFGTGLTLGDEPITVYLDNVSLKEGDVAVESLYNGDMETVLGGHSTDGDATMKYTAEGALITVNSLGGAAYQPHYFYEIPALGVGTYELKFVVTSSVTRDLRFNILLPDSGYASILTDGFSDFEVTEGEAYTFTATIVITQPITNVKVELDFGTLGGDNISTVGTFLLSEMLIYRNFNS